MARGRMLSRDASTDADLNSISIPAQLLYLLTLPHLDRDGLIDGRPTLLWAQAAPCRIDLLDQAPKLIQEWIAAGLVEQYSWRDGPILFFPGFRKHNSGLEYAKEPASKFPPPPNHTRGENGLLPDDEGESFRLAENFHARNAYAQELIAHANSVETAIARTSGTIPENIGITSSLREDKINNKRTTREENNNNNREEKTVADGDVFSDSETDHAKTWILSKMADMGWSGRQQYYDSLDPDLQRNLAAWLYHHQQCHDRYSNYNGPNPFTAIKNIPGFIKWSITQRNTPDLTPDEAGDLAAILSGDSIDRHYGEYDHIINR